MSGVNGIGIGAPGYVYSALSSGSKVQTAAQGASEMAILQEQQIEAMTVVTSDYHQLWGQTLFHAQAEKNRLAGGSPVRIIANYNWPAGSGSDIHGNGLLYTVFQLSEILGRP